ncbi:NAD-dependent epimerase/dehydratase [Bacillus cereus Rock4-18]|nr:NAD-dependent epimerase/dehydratase [Bacillus cereus Rock4-18]
MATKPLFYFITMWGFLLFTRLMNCSLSLGKIISVLCTP